jgi:DNA adenine methylase
LRPLLAVADSRGKHKMEPVRPISPVAGYVGGKRQLAKRLVEMIAERPHGLYAEPFVGMGGVFFRRTARPRVEAINDLNRDVATFFRILQRHYEPFLDMLKWRLASRADFQRLMDTPPDTLTDLERAARFLQLQRLGFGGKVAGRTFGHDSAGPARFDLTKLIPLLDAAHERISGVWIDCLPYTDFIARWDRPETLFFLDPPYWGSEHYYGRELFSRADFQRLAGALRGIRGGFIMTVNDVPELRGMFAWASIETAELTYSVGASNGKPAREIIITNRERSKPV